jgi:hypothetical protein
VDVQRVIDRVVAFVGRRRTLKVGIGLFVVLIVVQSGRQVHRERQSTTVQTRQLAKQRKAEAPGRAIGRRLQAMARRGEPMAEQRAELRRSLAEAGVKSRNVQQVLRHSANGIALVETRLPRRSHFGGDPVVATGTDAPQIDGSPLTLLADVDLAEVHAFAPLPPAGRLQLWFATSADSINPVETGRATWIAPGATTERVQHSSTIYPVQPAEAFAMPIPGESGSVVDAIPEGPQRDLVIDTMNGIVDMQSPGHGLRNQLLGSSTDVQGPVLEEISSDLTDDFGVTDEERSRYSASELRGEGWTLLAEIDGVTAYDDLMFGDGGSLYYAIPTTDLAARRFDRAIGIVQSH